LFNSIYQRKSRRKCYFIIKQRCDTQFKENTKVQISTEKFATYKVANFLARLPDLILIKNLYGILSRAVYRNNKHYSNIKKLKNTIRLEIDTMTL